MSAIDWDALLASVRAKTKARGINSLHDLDVNEISLVADPANLFSKVVISKRHDDSEKDDDVDLNHQPVVPTEEEVMPVVDGDSSAEEVEMLKGIVEQQEEVIDTLSKALQEVIGEEEMEKMAMEDDDDDEPDDYIDEDEEEELGKADVGIDQDMAMEDFPEEELDGEDLQKALMSVPPVIANLIVELSDRLEDQQVQIEKSNTAILEREAQIRNQEIMDKANQMTGLPMTHDDITQTLHILDQHLPPDEYDMIEDKLVKMSGVMMQQPITKEYGSSMAAIQGSSDTVARATEIARQIVKKSGGKYDEAIARAAVWEAEPELYNEWVLESQSQRGGNR